MHTARDRPKVVIVGAGIAGLSVAHELLRTGAFDIEVLEKRARAGGKARTVWQDERFREHSMRILPGSYVCMHQILAEIEAPSGRVIDRLRPSTIRFQKGDLRAVVRGDYSQRFGSFRYVGDAIRLLLFLNRAGVSARELVVFLYKAFSLLFTPERKVIRDLSRLTFAEYVTGGKSSPGFEKVIFRVAEILVAAKSHASAGVVMRTLLEWFVTPFLVGKYVRHQVSEFDSPTSDSLIEPWVDWLEAGGVRFRFGETTTEVLARAGRVKGLRLLGGRWRRRPRRGGRLRPRRTAQRRRCAAPGSSEEVHPRPGRLPAAWRGVGAQRAVSHPEAAGIAKRAGYSLRRRRRQPLVDRVQGLLEVDLERRLLAGARAGR